MTPAKSLSTANLDHLTLTETYHSVETIERWWVRMARNSPVHFITYLTEKELAKHHLQWLDWIFDFSVEELFRLLLIAPRESAKTTVIVYALVWFIARYPWKSNMLLSVSSKQAAERMRMIKETIAMNPRFRNVFPWIKIDMHLGVPNTQEEFSIEAEAVYDPTSGAAHPITYATWRGMIARFGSLKDPTLYVAGVGGSGIIGRRISGMMILDDIVDQKNLNPDIQEGLHNYILTTLVPELQEKAKLIYIGTRWTPSDVPSYLLKNPAWKSQTIKALETDPDTGELKSYWPEFWPVEKLLRRKQELNNDAVFELAYQNNPLALASSKFKIEGLQQPLPEVIPPLVALYVGTDFASSVKARADYTVFSAVGIDRMNRVYLLDLYRMKGQPDEWVLKLGTFCAKIVEKYGMLTRVLIEKTTFQTWGQNMLLEKFPTLPTDLVPLVGDKGYRLDTLARWANEMRFFVNMDIPDYKYFFSEAINFPDVHDDTLDAVTLPVNYHTLFTANPTLDFVKSPYMT